MNFLLRYNGYCHCCRSQVIFESKETTNTVIDKTKEFKDKITK